MSASVSLVSKMDKQSACDQLLIRSPPHLFPKYKRGVRNIGIHATLSLNRIPHFKAGASHILSIKFHSTSANEIQSGERSYANTWMTASQWREPLQIVSQSDAHRSITVGMNVIYVYTPQSYIWQRHRSKSYSELLIRGTPLCWTYRSYIGRKS